MVASVHTAVHTNVLVCEAFFALVDCGTRRAARVLTTQCH